MEADIKAEKPAALSKRLVTDNMETAMANSDPDNFSEEAYFVSFCSYCSLIFFSTDEAETKVILLTSSII